MPRSGDLEQMAFYREPDERATKTKKRGGTEYGLLTSDDGLHHLNTPVLWGLKDYQRW